MNLDLTDDEALTLRDLIRSYLPDLRREVARTDAHDYRHDLIKRQDLCEKLLSRLDQMIK
ncbi:MAG TPA: hypothetical protein VIF83_01520 [Gemmatimonadaceae bacterium]|jgi:hypothetical protein